MVETNNNASDVIISPFKWAKKNIIFIYFIILYFYILVLALLSSTRADNEVEKL